MRLLDFVRGGGSTKAESRPMQYKSAPFQLLGTASSDTAYFVNPLLALANLQNDGEAKLSMLRTSELIFACLEVLGNSAMDVLPGVYKRKTIKLEIPEAADKLDGRKFETGTREVWEEQPEHEFTKLMRRPNPAMHLQRFLSCWIKGKHSSGFFAAEIEYTDRTQTKIKYLWPLEPGRFRIVKYENKIPVDFEYRKKTSNGDVIVKLGRNDVFYDAWPLPVDWYYSTISPLEVAMNVADTDRSQTEYIRGFFRNSGVPSGLLKILNKTLKNTEADRIKRRFMNHFSQRSGGQHSPIVLDQNADYTPMGAKLAELEAENVQNRLETKLCMCFGVPPGLVGAISGMSHSSYATQTALLPDCWAIKLSPMYAEMAQTLMWSLLPIYETEDKLRSNKIKFGWDMRNVKALQEDQEKFAKRVALLYEKSIITRAQAQELLGLVPDPLAGHYLMNVRTTSMFPDISAIDAATFGSIPAIQSISVGDPNNPPADPASDDALDGAETISDDNVDQNDQQNTDPASADNPAGSEPT